MAYTIVLARTLPPKDFALTVYIVNFALVCSLVVTIGRDVTILRVGSIAWHTGARSYLLRLLHDSRKIVGASALILSTLLVLAKAAGLKNPVLQSYGTLLLACAITATLAQMALNRDCLRAIGMVWQSQLGTNFLRSIIPTLGSIVAIELGALTATMALSLFLASLLASLLLENLFLKKNNWQDQGREHTLPTDNVAASALKLWPGDIANAFQMRAAGLISAATLSPEQSALFLAAERIAALAQFPISAASQASAPKIAQATHGQTDSIQHTVREASKLMILGASVGTVLTALMAWPALLSFGGNYAAATTIALILTSSYASWIPFGMAQATLNLTGNHGTYSIVAILSALMYGLSVYCAAISHGVIGAAVASAVAFWITNLSYTVALHKITGLRSGIFAVYQNENITKK